MTINDIFNFFGTFCSIVSFGISLYTLKMAHDIKSSINIFNSSVNKQNSTENDASEHFSDTSIDKISKNIITGATSTGGDIVGGDKISN